jgi:hypothetical protein
MRRRVVAPKFGDQVTAVEEEVAAAITGAMGEATTGLKLGLRAQVRAAGLGAKLANTWRGEIYPSGTTSLDPAGYVYTNAPKIIDSYASGATIRPLAGRKYLWLPTKNVPRASGRGATKRMTPEEVENAFNDDLVIRPGRRGQLLALMPVVRSKNKSGGFRKATKGRIDQGRGVELVLMFTLVRSVRVAKRLDLDAEADRWGNTLPGLIDNRLR